MGYQAWNEANSIWQPYFPDFHCCRNDHISDHHLWPTPGKLYMLVFIRVMYPKNLYRYLVGSKASFG